MTAAVAVPVFVPDVPAAVLTAMALTSAVQAVAIDTVSTAPRLPVEPAAAVPVVSVLPALPVRPKMLISPALPSAQTAPMRARTLLRLYRLLRHRCFM